MTISTMCVICKLRSCFVICYCQWMLGFWRLPKGVCGTSLSGVQCVLALVVSLDRVPEHLMDYQARLGRCCGVFDMLKLQIILRMAGQHVLCSCLWSCCQPELV